jgi:hypothetical protein
VLLKSEGRSASAQVIERVASTLRTAAVHPDAARLVASGRLAGELDSPGFAAVAELAPPTRVKDGRRSSDTAEKRRRESERRRLEGHIERLERNLAAEEERADRAERTAAELRERVADVRAQLETARRELKQLAARS